MAATRWGLLSTARINDLIIDGAARTDAAEIVAVGSRDEARARAYAEEHGIAGAHGSYEALLADDGVDAIYIGLPNGMHHEWTLKALAAGKHVLCEKPYSRRPEEVVEAFDAADAAGLVLSEAFMWRHNPQTHRLVERLPEVGALRTIRATFSFNLSDLGDIRASTELDGGSLMDVGCYCVSGNRLLAGEEPTWVFGTQELGPTGVDFRFTGVLGFPSGAVGEFTCGFRSNHRGLEAIGADGSLSVADPWHSTDPAINRDGELERLPLAYSYQLELEDLHAAITGTKPPRLGRADALGQARTIAALYRSAESGARVEL